MKHFLILLALVVGSTAMANDNQPITCIKGDGDSIKILNIYPSGDIVMSFYEAHLYFKSQDVQQTRSAKAELDPTQIYSSINSTVHLAVEGEESDIQASLVFVYNEAQKAGRLTVISEGYTNLRNELFTGCNNNPISE